jgi:hypothetical protein
MADAVQPLVSHDDPGGAAVVPVPFAALPRARHIAKHLTADRERYPQITTPVADVELAFAAVITANTIENAAATVHMGRHQLEAMVPKFIEPYMPAPGLPLQLKRLAWCRIAYDIDPCWCER